MPRTGTQRFDCFDWNNALKALHDAATSSSEVSLQNLFWRSFVTPPVVITSTYSLVHSLSLRGNDVLSLLSLIYLPNLESLTLIFARTLLDENSVERPSPFDSIASEESLDSCSPEFPKSGLINNSYDLLVDFLKARNGRRCTKIGSLAIHDPFITNTDIGYLLSNPQIQEISSVSIGGLPDLLSQMTTFLTRNPNAYKLLGGSTRSLRPRIGIWYYPTEEETGTKDANSDLQNPLDVYDPEVDEALLGWKSHKSQYERSFRTLLEYEPKTGEVFFRSGRYHRVIGSF